MASCRARASERGQGTVEWIGLVLLASLLVAALGALIGVGVPGAGLAKAIASRIVCAAGLSGSCDPGESGLIAAYGDELAALVRSHAPVLRYEDGMVELPVDYRSCRADPCSLASGEGAVSRTADGLRAAAFVHVVDCRPEARVETAARGLDCSGERAGRLYLQYWLYYPDSQTEPFGGRGYHPDDWESYQVRIGSQAEARASSHHSYNHGGGIGNWPTDAGVWRKSGWGEASGEYFVSAESHAGHIADDEEGGRFTPGSRLLLIPAEPVAAAGPGADFAVTPPWLKRVWSDPEYEGTD